jgi:hypothetical protein
VYPFRKAQDSNIAALPNLDSVKNECTQMAGSSFCATHLGNTLFNVLAVINVPAVIAGPIHPGIRCSDFYTTPGYQ